MPLHLGKDSFFVVFFHNIWENWENKAIFGLGMTPVIGGKTDQIKSLYMYTTLSH